MRIALLTDGLWPLRVGGMEKHSWYFAKYLAKTGNDVHLFYPVQKVLFENHVPVFKGTHGITEYAIVEPQRGKLPGHYIRESRAVSELIYKKIRPLLSDFDLIYVQGFAGWELLQAKNSGLNCPPIWVNFHGLEMYQRAPGFWPKVVQIFFRPAVNENLKLADAAISLGGELGNILQEVVEKRVPVIEIPIGVEATWVREDEPELKTNRPLRFIFIGRNEKRKGLILLNTVLEKMNNRNDFVFDFIGPVSDSEKIISEKIKYHGLLKDENQIREIIKKSDVIVSPSYAEGMPTVLLEAMASGLAVCATEVGAVNCLVKGNGLLFEPGNLQALESALEYFITLSPVELQQKKLASIKLVKENYTWDSVIALTIQKMKDFLGVDKTVQQP